MDEKRLINIFQWLHRHPELALREYETTAYLKEILKQNGIRQIETGMETGALATIGKRGGPVIALRADIDALPIREETHLPYASENPGVMHACGHDFHATCMLGAALLLKEREKSLPGTVKIIFQPAEEADEGAKRLVKTGLLDDVRLFIAGHTYPWYEAGTIGIRPGPIMASADRFRIHLRGKGCHAAHPELGIDPIPAAGAIIAAAQTIASRTVNPFDSAVVSITRVEAGNTWNITPETADMEGTVRAMTEAVRQTVRGRLEELCKSTARAYGCEAELEYERGPDAVLNDPDACARAKAVALGMGLRVEENPPSMGSEDYSAYLTIAPGAFFRIGTGGGFDNHHPRFIADPSALAPAARFFAALAEAELNRLHAGD